MLRQTMCTNKIAERERIAKHVSAFFASGGTVTQLPHGESGAIQAFAPAKSKRNARKIQQRAGGDDE